MSELQWSGQTATMIDVLVKGAPLPIRILVRKSLHKSLKRMVGQTGTVEAAHVVAAVHDTTPTQWVKDALALLRPFHHCNARCETCSNDCPLQTP